MNELVTPPHRHVGEILTAWSGHPVLLDKPALLADDRSWTFEQLAAETNRLARVLRSSGVGRGHVVALLLPNCPEYVLMFFAVLKLGATVMPVNPALKAPEILYQLENAGAVQLIAHTSCAPQLVKVLEKVRTLRKVWYADAAADRLDSLHHFAPDHTAMPPEGAVDENDVALLVYTSGTTGFPRGVELTHRNVLANAAQAVAALGLTAEDRALLALPMYHTNRLVLGLAAPLLVGGSAAVRPGFAPERFWADVDRFRPTYFSGVPTTFNLLLSGSSPAGKPSLRFALCTAAALPAALGQEFEARFGVPLLAGYGLSEATSACAIARPGAERKPGSAGLPLPGESIGVLDAAGAELPGAQVGEIAVRGDNVMRGYRANPDATAEALRGGWLHTGDVGYIDADGHLFVVDRQKEMISRGGEKVYPKEVENTLYRHPKVREAAVVGVPDPVLGEKVKAYVVLPEGQQVDPQELIDFCRENLAPFKVPELVEFIAALPRNAAGKVAKGELRPKVTSGQ